jgi:two-component system sensor histidine kinase PilS (NtrC family)
MSLRWLFLFRLVLLIVLILLLSPNALGSATSALDIELAWWVLVGYALIVLLSGVAVYVRWPSAESQAHLAIYLDIVTFTLLMHLAGGVDSGLGIMIGLAVAAGALLMEGRLALLFASFAALAVLTEQMYSDLHQTASTATYTQAGFLGAIFFAVAIVAHLLYRRVREAEETAARRTVDIANLTKLNEFIIDNMETGVLAIDGDRQLRLANKAALRLLGLEEHQSSGPLARRAPALIHWLEGQAPDPAPEGTVVKVGERELRASLKLLGDYRSSGALVYLRDNQELGREAQQLKLAALGTLTASIAHNIRNPLSAITHASQLFAEGKTLPADDRHLLDIIQRNSARIDETVRSVLQLSRRHQAAPEQIDLASWLPEVTEEMREAYRITDARCTLDIAAPSAVVEADPRHLHQILSNLCENALMHGVLPDRLPKIEIRLARQEGVGSPWVIEVQDEGPGIDPSLVDDIFNPFFTTRSTGTGLGLYIARELAETNGIRLSYVPKEPHGSIFKLIFES